MGHGGLSVHSADDERMLYMDDCLLVSATPYVLKKIHSRWFPKVEQFCIK